MANNVVISILTPTYNRASLLPRLFVSLCEQTDHSFEWVIVDDGSTDDTNDVVRGFCVEQFDIRYFCKENGGKHTALNYGVPRCRGELVFIVDSDDWLDDCAVKTILSYHKNYYKFTNVAGFSFLRKYSDGSTNVSTGRDVDFISSYNRTRVFENRCGDMAEVYKKSILEDFRFPVFGGEKFLGEDVVWVEIGKKFDLVFSNKGIYYSNYLPEGLTKNRRKHNIECCRGAYFRSLVLLSIPLPLFLKCKTIMQKIIYGKFCGHKFKKIIGDSRSKLLTILLFLPSIFLKTVWILERSMKRDK